ncbi:MAG: DUF4080 domain-containing protein [Planctomyces sp.]|nr:DUF4080 domain-containing protein [Planctomyces sp.]
MARILLIALNAKYIHTAFGLRYLLANMGDLASETRLMEFVIHDSTIDIVSAVVEQSPEIVGLSVYIWNIQQMTQVARDLKRILPCTKIILGGPEVSYDLEGLEIAELADHIVQGEGDLTFPLLCHQILANETGIPKRISAPVPQLNNVKLPYDLYSDDDIAHRVVYVEASRGCPFTCEFCLSALDIPVRQFELTSFLNEMQKLLDRGVRQFKFVDRTFNLNMRVSRAILEFFLTRFQPGLFLHFEMIPDRLPEVLRDLIAQFPAGSLQFEIGVQTFNDLTGQLISRHQDNELLEQNFRFLTESTGVHIHADLIAGLPGEDIESFGRGFDRLYRLHPHEIQAGILKRLRGTPIVRHDHEWEMVYSANPPYEILSTRTMDFPTIQRLRRFARFWDLIGNSGNFSATLSLWLKTTESPFNAFMALSDWLFLEEKRRHGIALTRLYELTFLYLTSQCAFEPRIIAEAVWIDYQRQGRRDRPGFLSSFQLPNPGRHGTSPEGIPSRQARHQTARPGET